MNRGMNLFPSYILSYQILLSDDTSKVPKYMSFYLLYCSVQNDVII